MTFVSKATVAVFDHPRDYQNYIDGVFITSTA